MRKRTWPIGLALGIVAAACQGGAEGVCHDATCMAGATVTVVDDAVEGGALRAGRYGLVVGTGYAMKEWSCAPPEEPCELDWFTDFTDDGEAGTLSVQVRAAEGGLQVDMLETRGKVWSGPEDFFLKISRDDVQVADQMFDPEYEQVTASDTCVVCLVREGDELVVHLAK